MVFVLIVISRLRITIALVAMLAQALPRLRKASRDRPSVALAPPPGFPI
jgi:hypothetical protein